MTTDSKKIDDNIAYSGASYRWSHPRRIEALATLSGMQPQSLPSARILELGRAAGRNLIPQAQDYPEAEFVGIDKSGQQIAEGQAMIKALGIGNIQLRQANIQEVDDSWGKFDYILCHGIYSWVPADVRDSILAICQNNLNAEGIAYVSYNVLPGWYIRNIARDLMRYHTAGILDAAERLVPARAILGFVAKYSARDTPYAGLLLEEFDNVRQSDDAYVYAEFLENENHPFYFHEFIERAASRKLQYLGDANSARLTIRAIPEEARPMLAKLPLLKQQQYMDFLLNTTFRRTLLCHDHVHLARRRSGNYLDGFYIGLAGRPQTARLDVASTNRIEIAVGTNTVASASPFAKAAIQHLIDVFPGTVNIEELRSAAIAILEKAGYPLADKPATGVDDTASIVMEVYLGGAIELSLHPPRVATKISAFPVATPMARLQAASRGLVVNQVHETIELDQLTRHVVARLDGQRDLDWLRRDLQSAVEKSEAEVAPNSTRSLEEVLAWCRDHALLCE